MAHEDLRVDFRDVGQGNCSVIRRPDGLAILVDVGPAGNPTVAWLESSRSRISDVILTHNDADHAGALPAVVDLICKQGMPAKIWLLKDRPSSRGELAKMERILGKAADAEKRGFLNTVLLSKSLEIWKGGGHVLEVLYPSGAQLVLEGTSANRSSAVIALVRDDGLNLLWPGDNLIKVVADHMKPVPPYFLDGPHHGAPEDLDSADVDDNLLRAVGSHVFLSVGSRNRYNHPNPKYVRKLAGLGCCTSCSGLNKQCDSNFDSRHAGDHILDGTMLLGLGRSGSEISCRGSVSVWSRELGFEIDQWHSTHVERKTALRKAKCL